MMVGTPRLHCSLHLQFDVTTSTRVRPAGGTTFGSGKSIGAKLNEATLVEVPGSGDILANIRPDTGGPRVVARSSDGGETWTAPEPDAALINGGCQASMLRVGDDVFFSNPASLVGRCNGTMRRSSDGAATWPSAVPLGRPLDAFAYSCLTHTPAGNSIGVIFETGTPNVVSPSGAKLGGCYGVSCQIRY